MRVPACFSLPAIAFFAACTAVRTDPPTAAPDTDFELSVRATVRIESSVLRVRFDTVTEDSRCPADAQCVWEGNATVQLTVDSAGVARTVQLRTAGATEPARAFGVRLALRGLRPVPTTGASPRPGDYVATLRVNR